MKEFDRADSSAVSVVIALRRLRHISVGCALRATGKADS